MHTCAHAWRIMRLALHPGHVRPSAPCFRRPQPPPPLALSRIFCRLPRPSCPWSICAVLPKKVLAPVNSTVASTSPRVTAGGKHTHQCR